MGGESLRPFSDCNYVYWVILAAEVQRNSIGDKTRMSFRRYLEHLRSSKVGANSNRPNCKTNSENHNPALTNFQLPLRRPRVPNLGLPAFLEQLG